MSYRVVTASNKEPEAWYYLQKEFFASLKGEEPLVLDSSFGGEWKGLMTKPKWLYLAIKQGRIPEKYIIFPDNWDTVFGASCEEIIDTYLSMNADIVISAESNCFPEDYKSKYDELDIPAPYKYLNSGFIVGETNAILACLETMDLTYRTDDYWDDDNKKNIHPNDQMEWQRIFLEQPVKIKLDYLQRISQTLHSANPEDFDFSGERIINKITKSAPCSWHFNGGAKSRIELREPILNHLCLL